MRERIKRYFIRKRKLVIILSVVLVFALLGSLAPSNLVEIDASGRVTSVLGISITSEGHLSLQTDVILAAGEELTPGYQEMIPEAPGSETGLHVFPPKLQSDGSKDNWLSTSHLHKDVHCGTPIEDEDGDCINWNTSVGDIYVDEVSNDLVITAGTLSNKCKYDIEVSDYTLHGGEFYWDEELQKTLCSPVRAEFRDYVSGSGSDLYQLEDNPQFNDPKNYTIDNVEIRILVTGAQTGKCGAATKVSTNGKTFIGEVFQVDNTSEVWLTTTYVVNPNTDLEWTWQELQDFQAGVYLKKAECSWVKVFIKFWVGSQTFFPITPVEVTPDDVDQWDDCDVSANIPVGATGVILHIANTSFTSYEIGLRKNGSSDDRDGFMGAFNHFWAMIGVDGSRIFEAYVGHLTNIDIYLVGYTTSGVVFKTNADDMSLGDTQDWYDIDCSTEAPSAIGLIFELNCIYQMYYGLRKNGSSDDRHTDVYHHNAYAIIGCDGSQICEGWIEQTFVDFYLVGYITDGVTFNLNATDLSLGSTGTYADLTALPDVSPAPVMGIIEASSPGTYYYALREKGSSEDIYYWARMHPFAVVKCDEDRLIEGKISNLGLDFFLVGYATGPPACEENISNTPSSKAFGTVIDGSNKIEILRPTAAGDSTTFGTRFPPDINWESVDEVIANDDTDYVWTGVSPRKDLYNIANPTFPDGATINSVTLYTRCRRYESNAFMGYYGISSGETESWSDEVEFGVEYANYSKVYTTDPDTGEAWLKTAITALQIGEQTADNGGNKGMVCTQAYVKVDYTVFYWSKGSEPSWPLDDTECFFEVTNNSGGAVDITITATNFTGGDGWTLAGSPGEDIVTLKAGKSGDANEGAMVTLTTSPQAFISGLADSGTKKWEIKMETPTIFGDGAEKTSTVTLSATCQ